MRKHRKQIAIVIKVQVSETVPGLFSMKGKNMDSVLYALSEHIHGQNYVIASYYIKLPKEVDVIKKASTLAVGQTIGTWIPIPGITDEIREKYMGKVVNIFDIPALDLATQN